MNTRFFECKFQVPFHEVDRAGVLFYAHLFTHAHNTYEQFMKTIGCSLHDVVNGCRYAIPLVHASADYREPIRHDAEVSARLWLERISDNAFTVGYDFLAQDGRVCAHAETVHCCVDKSSGRKRAIPSDLRDRLLPYMI